MQGPGVCILINHFTNSAVNILFLGHERKSSRNDEVIGRKKKQT